MSNVCATVLIHFNLVKSISLSFRDGHGRKGPTMWQFIPPLFSRPTRSLTQKNRRHDFRLEHLLLYSLPKPLMKIKKGTLMKKTNHPVKISLTIALLALFAQACASTGTEKRIDSKMANEPEVSDSNALGSELKTLVDNSPKLSAVQKEKLLTLQAQTRDQLAKYREQALKLRSILIKDVIVSKYNPDEIELVKERLKKTEDRRLMVIFNAIDHANTIIGNELPENEEMLRSFYEIRLYN